MSERNERRLGLSGNRETAVKTLPITGPNEKTKQPWPLGWRELDVVSWTCSAAQDEVRKVAHKESPKEGLQPSAVGGMWGSSSVH